MITIDNVSKKYQQKNQSITVLEDVSFKIEKGSIFGIVGESGAGKTSLLRLILGLEKTDFGTIHVANRNITQDGFTSQMRYETATIFQNFNLLYNKNCFDNVNLPLKLQKRKDTKKVMEVLKFVGLDKHMDAYPATLSGGEKQRLAIARALVSNPKLLICDEPTASLDYQSSIAILKLLQAIHDELDTTIVLVTHDLGFARQICNQVAFLDQGKLVDTYMITKDEKEEHAQTYQEYVREILL